MNILSFFTKFLRFFPAEAAHHLALRGLKIVYMLGLLKYFYKSDTKFEGGVDINDLRKYPNKIGIAAGLDKNGDYIDCLGALGIGFIEVGTVTPRPQYGNKKPRIFRNIKDKSIINRLGFNNKGVDHLVRKLKNKKENVLVGSSIGKNLDTSIEDAHKDYLFCLEKIYEFSDYIAVNISSPNTKDLRKLSNPDYFNSLLIRLKLKQEDLSLAYGYRPIFIKISPDENLVDLRKICESVMENKLDGIICSNTTVEHSDKNGSGGLSGAPLKAKSTECLVFVKNIVGDKLSIIASGGVMSVSDYKEKIAAGADLVQLYSGFIYEGPKLIKDIISLEKSK